MTCHHCRHAQEIGRLAENPSEQERLRLAAICSRCRLGADLPGDGSVSLDAITDGTLDRVAEVAHTHRTAYTFDPGEIDEAEASTDAATQTRDALTTLLSCVAALPYEEVARLAKIADVFKTLTRQEFEIVAHLLNGGTMTSYAAAYGLLKQTAFARMKMLFRKHPVFLSIANGKLGRGAGGRKAGGEAAQRRIEQQALFEPERCC